MTAHSTKAASIASQDSEKAYEGSSDHPESGLGSSRSSLEATPQQELSSKKNYARWFQALGCFILFGNTWGVILAFGAFQTFYEQDLLRQHSSSDIAWIGTVSAFLLLLGGATSGKIYDLGYSRVLMVSGSFLVVFGLMMTSLATEYYQIFLAQGVTVGLGTSLLWIPAMTVVAVAFTGKMRAIVIGLVSSGSSIGGVIYPIMFRLLQPSVGFPWTVRIMAFVALGTFIIALVVLLPPKPTKSPRARQLFDKTALTDLPYMIFSSAGIFILLGYFVPLVFLPSYVESHIHHSTADLAFYTLAVANGSSSISRIGGGFVAAKIGPCATYTIALLLSGILLLAWIAINSIAGVMVWAVLWGLTTGLIISMPGAIIPQLCPDPKLLGTRMGLSFLGPSIGVLIGGPIGGKLIYAVSSQEPTWWPLQVFTGLSMLIGSALTVYPWIHVSRRQKQQQ